MVERSDFNGNEEYGCDTCGRLFWRLADCPRVSSYKKGIIIGFRHRVYVNQCLSCKRMAGQQQYAPPQQKYASPQQKYAPPQQKYAPPKQKKDSWRSVFIPDIFNSDLDQYRPKMRPPEPRKMQSQMTQAEREASSEAARKKNQEKWQELENLSSTIIDKFLTFVGAVILFWIGLFLLMLTISIAVDYM